jgi:hypothetical protein
VRAGIWLLLTASPAFGQAAVAILCPAGDSIESHPVPGPGGLVAAVKIWADGDHNKNLHNCEAGYELLVGGPGKRTEFRIANTGLDDWDRSFMHSDAEYGRRLEARLDGFSRDGKRVFGAISEGGQYPFAMLFWRDVASGKTQTVDLEGFSIPGGGRCGAGVAVAGTTPAGAIVLQPDTVEACRNNFRWQLDPAPLGPGMESNDDRPYRDGRLKPLPPGAEINPLYREGQP